jgi:hypothetical protein
MEKEDQNEAILPSIDPFPAYSLAVGDSSDVCEQS